MTETTDRVVADFGAFSLTRTEAVALVGTGVVLVGMGLPWMPSVLGSPERIGLAFGPITPVIVGAAVLAGLVALPDPRPLERHALIALDGITVVGHGIILVLGLSLTGIGIPVTTLGGFLITGAGYTELVRRTSIYRTMAVICVGGALSIVGTFALIG